MLNAFKARIGLRDNFKDTFKTLRLVKSFQQLDEKLRLANISFDRDNYRSLNFDLFHIFDILLALLFPVRNYGARMALGSP